MIIDFHTHVFPNEIAPKAKASLLKNLNNKLSPVTDMTLHGLLKHMEKAGVDISVNLPVVTKESQFKNTNEWAKSICSEKLISFGGIYPHTENYKKDIDFVVSLGFKGIKFHAEYQNFVLDDIKMLRIYDYAISKDLIIVHHAGVDYGIKPPCKSSPKQFANLADRMKGGVIVAAHFGGFHQWDDVEKHLAGKNIYLDTSMGFEYFSHEQFLNILKLHGSEKILFASDSPWSDSKKEIEHIKSLPISQSDMDNILYKNAKRILDI